MRNILFILLALSIFVACRKEPDQPAPTTPQDPALFKIPLFEACDTSQGRAYAVKDLRVWYGGGSCRSYTLDGEKYWVIEFFTCSEDGSHREHLAFSIIPDKNPVNTFAVSTSKTLNQDVSIASGYATLLADGDVLDDVFHPDTTAMHNSFTIDKWDTVAKRAEGHFSVTYKRTFGGSPITFLMQAGKFWVKLP